MSISLDFLLEYSLSWIWPDLHCQIWLKRELGPDLGESHYTDMSLAFCITVTLTRNINNILQHRR